MKISRAAFALTFVFWSSFQLLAVEQPYAHWRFDEGTDSTANDRIGSAHATLEGGVGWQLRESGYSIDLSGVGGSYAIINSVDDPPIIPDDSDFSVSVWIKPEPSSLSSRDAIYGYYSTNSWSHAAYFMEINNGGLRVGLGYGDGSDIQIISNLHGAHTLVAGEWVHWTVVREGNQLQSYINGQLEATTTVAGNVPRAGTPGDKRELIGASFAGSHNNFEGEIDELRVWREAISEETIQRAYSGAYAHWEFEVMNGTTIVDSNGDNDGTASAMATLFSGQPGDAIKLAASSDDHVRINASGSAPVIPDESNFTISVWINPTSYSVRQEIYGYYSSSSWNQAAYFLEINNGGLRVGLGYGNGSAIQIISNLHGDHTLVAGDWVHWTVVREGSELRSYINGELTGPAHTVFGNVPRVGTTGTMRELIGAAFAGAHNNFDGRIDDLRVWRKALDDSSVKDVFYDSMIDIRDWGTAGILTTQNINDALTASQGDGKFVLWDGTFTTDDPISLNSNTNLYGRNDATLMNSNRDETYESFPMLNVGSQCEVHDLTINSAGKGVEGIRILNRSDILLNRCKIMDIDRSSAKVNGIVIRQTGSNCSNITLQECIFDNIRYSGNDPTHNGNCRGLMITSPTVGDSMDNIVVDKCNFSNIRSTNGGKDGDCININVKGSTNTDWDFTITNCDFTDFSKRGVKAQADRVYVYDCKFHEPKLTSLTGRAIALFGSHSRAELNRIEFSQQHNASGISINGESSTNNVCVDNTILLSATPVAPTAGRSSGFYFESRVTMGGNNTITDNEIQGGLYGISVYKAATSNNTFTNNVVDVTQQTYFNPNGATNTVEDNILPWITGLQYDPGDEVVHNNKVYECAQTTTSHVPGSSSTYWNFVRDVF